MIINKIKQLIWENKEKPQEKPKVNFGTGEPEEETKSGAQLVSAEQVLAQRGVYSPKSAPKPQYTPEKVRKIICGFLKNNPYEMSIHQTLLDNIENLDYEHIEEHLRNIKIFINCEKNDASTPVTNGYFYSETGLKAFNMLLSHYSVQAEDGCNSPIAAPLEEYTPEEVLKANDRGFIDELGDYNPVIKQLVKMTDEEFAVCKEKALKSIQDTGKTYDELYEELKTKIMSEDFHDKEKEHYLNTCINEFTIVPHLQIIHCLKNYPVKLDDYDLTGVLCDTYINNYESRINILEQLKSRKDITPHYTEGVITIVNEKTEKAISELIKQEDIPLNKIIEYCNKNKDFKNGLVSASEILSQIDNDPFLRTIKKLKDIDVAPNNTTPAELNPRDIKPEALVLVHMTNYEPENNVILSTRDKIGGSRNSVHFTLNHPVEEHHAGSWDNCKYAIIMPFETTVKANNKGKFIEGLPNDLYTNGSVKIPEGSVLVKYNETMPEGCVNVSQSTSLNGVKVIETSQHPHEIVPEIIKEMGYTNMKANGPIGLFSYGENNGKTLSSAMENYKAWEKFCDSAGIKLMHHTGSPGQIAEGIIENIDMLSANGSWHEKDFGNNDYRKNLLKAANFVKKWQDKGYFVSYDIDKVINIIKKCRTPMQAREKLQPELGFHPTLKRNRFNSCIIPREEDLSLYDKYMELMYAKSDSATEELLLNSLKYM
ncbi:hypothetical protein II906_11995 [bacterium]|nr:hypothetical protein [bacterium]